MPPPRDLASLESELSGLRMRRDSLRQAAGLPGAELGPALEAALAELDAAIDLLAAQQQGAAQASGEIPSDAVSAERQLLRAAFQDAPVPLFLLERNGTVRRANRAAGELTGAGTGYATGRPFTAFLNLPSRAAVQTQLAAVIRTGEGREVSCELLTPDGPVECELAAGRVQLRGDADQLVVAVRPHGPAARAASLPAAGKRGRAAGGARGKQARPAPEDAPPPVVAAMTRRLDLVTAASRLLLENVPRSESVTVQRCTRLLADELAAWAIVDVVRDGGLRRQFVMGPEDQRSAELARVVAAADPAPGTVPAAVAESGGSRLEAHAEDLGMLGTSQDGVPLLMLLGATSVLSVPISAGAETYGVLTLARPATAGYFQLADLGLVEELGQQLALAVRVDQMVQRQSRIADSLRAGLLPGELPGLPGVELATAHLAATGAAEMSGDFFDAYRTGAAGGGVSIGDVSGRGKGVAAASAAARHTIRVLAYSIADPAQVLARANEILVAEGLGGRFVTAAAAHAEWHGESLRVALACAGHPGPVLLRRDDRVQPTGGGGLPLGLFPDAEPGREEHTLAPGDTILFYTDGLPGACGPQAGHFEDRLAGEIAGLAGQPPAQLLERLQARAQAWCDGDVRDDITMLALQAVAPPGKT